MSPKPTVRQRWQYFFDNYMSKGTAALIGGLAVISLALIFIAGAIISIGGRILGPLVDGQQERLAFTEAAWMSLMRTFDAGTMGGDAGWGFRWVMLFVTIGGILIVGTLIGVLTTGVESKMEDLRKGRSQVLESGHTLILGWSAQVFTILSELMIANANQKNARIVILADKDKVEMEDELRSRVAAVGRTRIICRSGNPIDLTDLEIARPHDAKAIIVLPPNDDNPDSYVIKTILALTNNPKRRPDPYHIVTQISDPKNMAVVEMIGVKDNILAIPSGKLIARLLAQTSRQSGLSVVYTELLNYGGDEIYFQEVPALAGRTFGESLLQFEDSAVIGLCRADGTVALGPAMDTRLSAGDRIVAVSADDDTVRISGMAAIPVDEGAIIADSKPFEPAPEKCLVIGWNRNAATILQELDSYVAQGSQVMVVADIEISQETADAPREVNACASRMQNQTIMFRAGDATDRALLEELEAAEYDHIIVLSYDGLEVQAADSKTLVTLLHLRDIAEKDETPFSIVSEMRDLRNRQLAEAARVDDFIVSDHLISLMMAQLGENAKLFPVFTDLFDPEGVEIYLKPVSDYVEAGKPVTFYTVVEAARRRGHVAFGYRLAHEAVDAEKSYGVHTNPRKSDIITFAREDKVIVVAED